MSRYAMMFRSNKGNIAEYNAAVREAKNGLAMVMDGLEADHKGMIAEGAEMAWDGLKRVCAVSEEMKEQYGERRGGSMNYHHDNYGMKSYHKEWNDDDDRMMERRMRDSKGRYM